MSIYKGGYILADISDTALTDTGQDLLPQELKEYLSKYQNKDGEHTFKIEVLMKPIKLIARIETGERAIVEFNIISDDNTALIGSVTISYGEGATYEFRIESASLEIRVLTKDL